MKKYIKFSLYPLFAILLYFFCIIRVPYIKNLNIYALIVCTIIFIYLILKGAVTKNKKYFSMNLFLYIFAIMAIASALINSSNIDGTILFALKIINIVLFIEYIFEIGKDRKISIIFFVLSTFMSIVTIGFAKMHPLAAWQNDLNYFIGSKFLVSYNAISSIIFFTYGFSKSKTKFWHKSIFLLTCILSIYTSIYVKCSTGIVGSIFVIAFFILIKLKKDNKFNFFMKPNVPIIILISSALIVILLDKIFELPVIKHIIVEVFNKSEDLSGRLIIYKNISNYFKDHMLFGYGYNTVYGLFKDTMLIRTNTYAYDAQNALLEYLLYFGVFGCTFFLFFVRACFNKLKKLRMEEVKSKYCYIIGFYTLVFLGIVEITINPLFYLFLAFIACLPNEKTQKNNSKYLNYIEKNFKEES